MKDAMFHDSMYITKLLSCFLKDSWQPTVKNAKLCICMPAHMHACTNRAELKCFFRVQLLVAIVKTVEVNECGEWLSCRRCSTSTMTV
jgi:hypothetical protein